MSTTTPTPTTTATPASPSSSSQHEKEAIEQQPPTTLKEIKAKLKLEEKEKKKTLEVIENSRLFRSRRTINIIKSIPQSNKERTWKQKLYLLLEHPRSSYVAMIITVITSLMTVIQTLCLILRSFPFFFPFEIMWLLITGFLSVCFMLEYFARMAAYVNTWGDFRHFVKAPANLIDIASFVPFYFDLIIYMADASTWLNVNLQVLTIFRVLKLLKLIKLTRYSAKFQLLIVSLRRSMDMLLSISVLIFMGALICSTLVYYAERGKYDLKSGQWLRPDGTPSPFSNILICMWYSVVTIATVGYGDMAPVTVLGRIIAIMTILSGIVIVALPSMVIGGIYSKLLGEYELMLSKRKLEGDVNFEDEEFDVIDNDDAISQAPSEAQSNVDLISFESQSIPQSNDIELDDKPTITTEPSYFSQHFNTFEPQPTIVTEYSQPLPPARDMTLRGIFDRQNSIIKSCSNQLSEMKRLAQTVRAVKQSQ
ncbi:predicted protein [Naegleria gruberi]|uniref:Predicted protein n=1 Tax=Naegleria gruberi TaxID=5762 RepID=D2VG66_NAEGR|nr:uncharacterized protein NAEGRDRAFT_67869 [Naegleria gruberi]EFC44294.1 predicted protein [Naegleria gruberi]|eukprot:XP_002677038.1 predicted protein [Naegleria gruberi strain NEG-M]